jgi:methionyl-tRNA formyltransferase
MMRIIFMGSPEDVVSPLKYMWEHGSALGFELVAIVSQPARPVGRGGKMQDPPVASYGKEHGIFCLQPESARAPEFLTELKSLHPDVIITAAYGQILSEEFLQIPKIGTINIHPSRLPQYRGATPVPAALLDGLTNTAVTILFTVKKLDAGNIILQKDFSISPEETAGSLTKRLFAESGPMLIEALQTLKQDAMFKGVPQNDAEATFCKKIEKEMGMIDWTRNAVTILNQFRAFEPWPGSWTLLGDKRVAITDMVLTSTGLSETAKFGTFQFDKPSKSLVVKCSQGAVAVRRLKPAGGKDMDAASFWNGLKDKSQVVFLTDSVVPS